MGLGIVFSGFLCLGFVELLDLWVSSFHQLWGILAIIASNISSVIPLPPHKGLHLHAR